jgi:hypothetical protein
MIYNRGKVIGGVIIFLVLVSVPFWYDGITGKGAYVPSFETPGEARQCIEATPYMRADHMRLLDGWKESVVRKGARTYVASGGKKYTMSLTGTCLKCHSNKEEFCDRCHNYTGVEPNCWRCHVYLKTTARTDG